jgi:hypothetical protein
MRSPPNVLTSIRTGCANNGFGLNIDSAHLLLVKLGATSDEIGDASGPAFKLRCGSALSEEEAS